MLTSLFYFLFFTSLVSVTGSYTENEPQLSCDRVRPYIRVCRQKGTI